MIDPLLAICARVKTHPLLQKNIKTLAGNYTGWETSPARAEQNGVAPLFYTHLKSANVQIPENTDKLLMGLLLRHRAANKIRNRVLTEILSAFKAADIEVFVLKGAALANSIYPQAGLRPMRDLDVLVRKQAVQRAQLILLELGFEGDFNQPPGSATIHHMPVARRKEGGLSLSVEVHHQLLPYPTPQGQFSELARAAESFNVNKVGAQTLGHEDMLWHIYRHAFSIPLIQQPIRLIWVADFVGLVEKHFVEIDWRIVRHKYPQVWQAIPAFHFLTPWSEKVIRHLELEVSDPPNGIGQSFQGWPQASIAQQKSKGLANIIRDTLWPSEWWVQLYYGTDRRPPRWWWYRYLRHPIHIFGWFTQLVRQRSKSYLTTWKRN